MDLRSVAFNKYRRTRSTIERSWRKRPESFGRERQKFGKGASVSWGRGKEPQAGVCQCHPINFHSYPTKVLPYHDGSSVTSLCRYQHGFASSVDALSLLLSLFRLCRHPFLEYKRTSADPSYSFLLLVSQFHVVPVTTRHCSRWDLGRFLVYL